MLYLRGNDIIFIMENGKFLYIYFPFFQDYKIGEHFMKYIRESIGEEYKNWKERHTIFISSPTGSGKTAFILNVLLSHLAGMGKEMLYLVNRSILMNQIKNEINNLAYTSRKAITVMLYQEIENKYFKYDGSLNEEYFKRFEKYDCVICDEAHYFLMDSNYNTRTILSFNFIRNFFMNKLRIYMSATIDDIKAFIKEDNVGNRYIRTKWLSIGYNINNNQNVRYSDRFHILTISNELTYPNSSEYQVRNYDYIDIEIIKQKSEISKLVLDGNEKWIIFVDTKEFGKSLKKDIIRNIRDRGIVPSKDAVAFITSDYELDPDSSIEVDTIVSKNKTLTKVLIATSVLDNGINIKDMELRNVIIIADTETEFIQMLGRKRSDGKRLKLYIFKHNKQHFEQRRRINIKRRKIAEEVYSDIENKIQEHILEQNLAQNQEGHLTRSTSEEKLNKYEFYLIAIWHRNLLNRMMSNEVSFENIKCSFYAYDGCLVLNPLSFRNFENLNQFYTQLLSEFESYGENAFLRKQLRWLGKSDQEIEKIIFKANENLSNRARNRILIELQEAVDKEMTKEEFKEFRLRITDDFCTLIESVDEDHPDRQKFINMIKKNDRVMSKPSLVFLKENCEIPFTWEKIGKNYVVKRIMD